MSTESLPADIKGCRLLIVPIVHLLATLWVSNKIVYCEAVECMADGRDRRLSHYLFLHVNYVLHIPC